MYETIVINQDQALCHLFFHCCLEDDRFTEPEMNDLSGKLVELGLQPKVKIKEELISYRSYKSSITDEPAYLRHLIQLINPVNELALYSYCVELCIDDPSLDPREVTLLNRLAEVLDIAPDTEAIIHKLTAQRKAVELQKIF
ncbi:MAG TPA: hypothetical protein VL832_15075 [Puia sp.]|jgi:uncharacterized tellurite resistance protein B-like protein|nr:hypothetical protein [Puia sp.]